MFENDSDFLTNDIYVSNILLKISKYLNCERRKILSSQKFRKNLNFLSTYRVSLVVQAKRR